MTTIPTQTVGTDGEMPMIGLGLWKIDPDHVADAVIAAIRAGYRHLDSACDYGNEKQVDEGIRTVRDTLSAGMGA